MNNSAREEASNVDNPAKEEASTKHFVQDKVTVEPDKERLDTESTVEAFRRKLEVH